MFIENWKFKKHVWFTVCSIVLFILKKSSVGEF